MLKTPPDPYVFVLNSGVREICAMCENSRVDYRIGPSKDAPKNESVRGLYVNKFDLNKLAKFFRSQGMNTQAHWCEKARP